MKMTRSAKLFTGLGLMASLFWGCQDLLSQKDGSAKDPDAIASDLSALRLSIKDDSTCRDQWEGILDARAQGLADTAAEKSFLANCVTEVKPGKDKLPPIIPPHLQPDSISRCHWIVAQIEGGRDEMTVSYKRYCPEDCHKLEDKDSTRHDHLCHDPHGPGVDTTKPPKPPVDTTKPPKPPIDTTKPNPPNDSCKLFRDRLSGLDSTSVEAANLRQYLLLHCGKPPVDTTKPPKPPIDTIKPPKPPIDTTKPPVDTTKPPKPPVDTTKPPKPPIDTTKPNPPDDSCKIVRARLIGLDSTSAEAESLRQFLSARCGKPPVPPMDTLPKPIPPCDDLRAKLLTLDPASADSKLLAEAILQHCTEVKP